MTALDMSKFNKSKADFLFVLLAGLAWINNEDTLSRLLNTPLGILSARNNAPALKKLTMASIFLCSYARPVTFLHIIPSTSAPFWINHPETLTCPCWLARWRGVWWNFHMRGVSVPAFWFSRLLHSLTLFGTFKSAPFSFNHWQTAKWPSSAAKWRGVLWS